jgi:hypothetical protein
MKKVLHALVVLAVTATLFSSCKSRENCPAYGKLDNAKTQQSERF